MKILQINKYFYKKGGAETVFFNTINLLKKNGHDVIPFCMNSPKNIESPYSKYFINYPELSEVGTIDKIKNMVSFFYNREAAKKLEELIINEKPDIAHIHLMFNSLSISILPVLKKHNIPTVMSVHDYRLVCPAYTFTDGKGNICERCKTENYYNCIKYRCSKGNIINSIMLSIDSYLRKFTYSPLNYINYFLFVSKFAMNKHIEINRNYNQKSSYLYNFTPKIETSETKVPQSYYLYFGRMSHEKGIETLLKAFKETPNIKLKLAGTGPLLETLKKQSQPNIEFLGFKQGAELEKLIKEASFVIVPSEWYENNPMTIIESFMLGTPVIGSDIGGIPELINNERNGYTFRHGSTEALIQTILKSYSLPLAEYKEMSNKAKIFALEHFSEDAYYKKLITIYNKLLHNEIT